MTTEAARAAERWSEQLASSAERIAFEALNENDALGLALVIAETMLASDLVLPMRYQGGAVKLWRFGSQAEILTARDQRGRWLVRTDARSAVTAHETIAEAFDAAARLLGVLIEVDE